MRARQVVSSLLLVFLFSASLPAVKNPALRVCGTSPALARQEHFLHRQATKRRTRMLEAGQRTMTVGGKSLDLEKATASVQDDVFVMGSGAGVVIPRNVFSGIRAIREVRFAPTSETATAYKLSITDGTVSQYREYALQAPAIDLTRPATGEPIPEDGAREFPLPFPFTFYGKTYDKVFVNSNGHITFERSDTPGLSLDFGGFLGGPPKIAGAALDLDTEFLSPGSGLYFYSTPSEVIVSYVDLPMFLGSTPAVDFQIRLTPANEIGIVHNQAVNTSDIFLIGTTPGENMDLGTLVSFLDPPSEEISGSIAEIFSNEGGLDVIRATQVFYQLQPDDYDYLVFYNNRGIGAGSGAIAFELTIRSTVTGIGEDPLDFSEFLGSPKRLQAILNMGQLQQYPNDPNALMDPALIGPTENTALTVLAHEAGHRFLAKPLLREGNNNASMNLLGRQLAHWSFLFNSHASFLEGNEYVPVDGEARSYRSQAPNQRYSELDRYLMGLIPPEQVGVQQQLFHIESDVFVSRSQGPRRDRTIIGERRDFSINDIIAANGVRSPDHTISQKRFRMAFILITEDGTIPPGDEDDLAKVNAFRTAFVDFFHEKTGNLATVDTAVRPGLELNLYPAAAVLQGGQGTATVRRRQAGAALPLRVETAGSGLSIAGNAEIATDQTSVGIPFTATTAGVTTLRVFAENNAFLPAEANVAVVTPEQLRLAFVGASRVQAAPNTQAASPIRVRVTDLRGLPVQGVDLRFEANNGGSGAPSSAFSDANGEAEFVWTVGSSSVNEAVIFVAGLRAASEIKAFALETLAPEVRAATHGARFTGGISPGALATLFGVSMAGGKTRSATLPLPTQLEGVRVSINGVFAELIFLSDLQINFFVPFFLTGDTATIVVTSPDGASQPFETPLRAFDPGIFFDSGTNLGAILPAGTGQKTDIRPATPGGFVEIYATGLGPVVSRGRGTFVTEKPVTVRINGQDLPTDDVPYAGLAPGFAGLYQVNAKVPTNLAPGTYTVQLIVEGQASNEVNLIVGAAAP